MKIAVVISGLARFPEQGFPFLERIVQQSKHQIDIFAGVWSIDTIPDHIAYKLKGISYIPHDIKNRFHALLEDNLLSGKLFSFHCVTEQHAGLIGHMAACDAFKNHLINYDLIIKWRWDVAVLPADFELICNSYSLNAQTIITDVVDEYNGYNAMNEVVFAAAPDTMLSTFTPVTDKYLHLCKELQIDAVKIGPNIIVGSLCAHAKLVKLHNISIYTVPFKWALLRENILDNLEYVNCQQIDLLMKLQQQGDRKRDFELKKINSSTLSRSE
jgi:hypothetical protein